MSDSPVICQIHEHPSGDGICDACRRAYTGIPFPKPSAPVVSLADMRNAPVPEVVEVLEHMLAEAKEGKIRGLVVAAGLEGRAFLTSITRGDAGIVTLIGALRVVERDLLRDVD